MFHGHILHSAQKKPIVQTWKLFDGLLIRWGTSFKQSSILTASCYSLCTYLFFSETSSQCQPYNGPTHAKQKIYLKIHLQMKVLNEPKEKVDKWKHIF